MQQDPRKRSCVGELEAISEVEIALQMAWQLLLVLNIPNVGASWTGDFRFMKNSSLLCT